jgi:hypothetical protein
MFDFVVLKGDELNFLVVQPEDLNKLVASLIEKMTDEQLRQWINECPYFPKDMKTAFMLKDENHLKDSLCGFMIMQNSYHRQHPHQQQESI